MERASLPGAQSYAAAHRRKRRWLRAVTALAAVVVFCTTYALILPAVTMTRVLTCDIPEHSHGEACYETVSLLTCDLPEHTHGEECFDGEGDLLCELEEHSHTESCRAQERTLICETTAHTHTEDCYAPEEVYACGLEEHTHGEGCFDGEGVLSCTLSEHSHDENCSPSDPGSPEVAEPEPEPTEPEPAEPEATEAEPEPGSPSTEPSDVLPTEEPSPETPVDVSPPPEAQEELPQPSELPPPSLTPEEQAIAEELTALIGALPSVEEVSARMEELEETEDWEGLAAYYAEVGERCQTLWERYTLLSDEGQAAVANVGTLTDLEWLWSGQTLIDEIDFTDPTPVQSASTSDFIELNLYDYNGYINDEHYRQNSEYPGFQWNGGAYVPQDDDGIDAYNRHQVDCIDFGNSNITDFSYGSPSFGANGKSEHAVIVGKLYTYNSAKDTGAINRLWWDGSNGATITNRPVGMSTGIEALSRTLVNGYPALSDGTSLSYLFKDDNYSVFKQNTQSIDGLFQKDETTGEYYFNSRWNHAQYNDEDDTFTLYDQIITPNFIVYPFGNFLPFNTITDSTKATQVGKITSVSGYIDQLVSDMSGSLSVSPTKTQLTAMLKKYQEDIAGTNITSARDAIVDYFTASGGSGDKPSTDTSLISDVLLNKMYNIDWDEETNFFFGMEMSMEFFQPKGGMTGNDTDKDGQPDYPMEFYFTGDDDVWVYIDDVLFLDLTGIHRHVGGKIDFVNGKVYYYALDTANGGDVSSDPYQTFTFKELLEKAGKSTDGLNDKGAFQDYTTHSFQFYYMERGSGSSVCRMNFNFPLLKKNSISVTKEVSTESVLLLGDPDFEFQVLKADENGNKTDKLFLPAGTAYQLYDKDGTELTGEYKTDENGVFTLKAGQTAVFSNISESSDQYFVRELLDESVYEQYDKFTVDGTVVNINQDNVPVGDSTTFKGVDSPVKTASGGSTKFTFNNHVDQEKLSHLSVTKTVAPLPKARDGQCFRFEIDMDGAPLPVGTAYTVGTQPRTVTEAGILELAHDETAVFENLLAGSRFTVREVDADGYRVTYTVQSSPQEGKASQAVSAGSNVNVSILNTELGASVDIPVKKTLNRPDGAEHSYTFRLEEVTDQSGTESVSDGAFKELTIALTDGGPAEKAFELGYPTATEPGDFFYKITETAGTENTVYDPAVYVVKVTLSVSGAEITGIWKDGTAHEGDISFVNTLGTYELPKTGGIGTTRYLAGGLALCLSAALWLWKRSRKKTF